jgi:uncharacterized protein (DUF58 family)
MPELMVGAAACGALLALGIVYTQAVAIPVQAERHLVPARMHRFRRARIELAFANTGRRPSPLLSVTDRVDGARSATMLVGPLGPSERAEATYELRAERRGILEVGPLEIELRDPFGLARRQLTSAPPTKLVVLPEIEPVQLRLAGGTTFDLESPRLGSGLAGWHGDEPYSLRPYAPGDDVRRVHWRSTAHRGELVIRQDQARGRGSLTVLLDLRTPPHTEASVERAVSVAASVAVAAARARLAVRLVTTAGFDSGLGTGPAPLSRLLEHLATVRPSPPTPLAGTSAGATGDRRRPTVLVVVTALGIELPDLRAVRALRQRVGAVVVLALETGSTSKQADALARPGAFPGLPLVVVKRGQPLAAAWAQRSSAEPARAQRGSAEPAVRR